MSFMTVSTSSRTLINRLNLIPWHVLHIPGVLFIALGIYTFYRALGPLAASKNFDIAYCGYYLVAAAGWLTIHVGFFLCVAWWIMRGKMWMTREEAERQQRGGEGNETMESNGEKPHSGV